MPKLWSQIISYTANAGAGFIAVVCGAVVVLALFALNLSIAAKRGEASDAVSLAAHFAALAVIAGNIVRVFNAETQSVVLGNAAAFCCILYSLRRQLREGAAKRKGGGK